jgi:sarcosine oxidase subunit alpha
MPRQRLWKVFAKEVVIATGAIERPLVFDRNDVPGVMLAGAAQRYARQYAVKPGSRAVIFTNNDCGYEAALALSASGIDIAAVVDSRTETAAATDAREHGINVTPGHAVVRAHGRKRVSGVSVAVIDAAGNVSNGSSRSIACDLVCLAGGWDPAVHLFSQSGGKLAFDEDQQCFVPGAPAQRTHAAGAANGAFAVSDCVAQGRAGGLAAARACSLIPDPSPEGRRETSPSPSGTGEFFEPPPGQITNPSPSGREVGVRALSDEAAKTVAPLKIHPLWTVPGDARKQFVDLQHDVTTSDLALAAREGYVSVEHAKRYTTTGMGVDQGKTGNIIAFGVLGQLTGRTIPQVGTTTFRPPYTPVTIGALAGREIGQHLDPARRTPITEWHETAGAIFEPVGLWSRPLYYPRAGEDMHAAVARECKAVRTGVALLDASTLGKIDIQGRDALTLLNRVYSNAWDSLAVGRCRYGLMLGEDGMILDDGVTARLGEHHYLMSTTSGGADRVYAWLEDWLQCEWRDLEVYLTPVTAHWANVCVTGPKAREVLAQLGSDIDFSADAFPHMSAREGTIGGAPARVMRVSFTGELSYEINVPARYGQALWDTLWAAGAKDGITSLGTEALHVLRAEKGYIAVGHETDGTVNPFDLGLERLVSVKKTDFLGKRGLRRSDNIRPGRKQLVGLMTDDAWRVVREGSQIVSDAHRDRLDRPPVPMIGHVTSSYMSATLGRSIALALVEDGRRRLGERVQVVARGQPVSARICAPVFYDPEGARLHG